jgi:VIT1/CCC1 family predicted Fe2+/Mn2+ transporter
VSQADDTLRILLRDLAKESAKPTIGRRGQRRSASGGTVTGMQSALSSRILVALSVAYGGAIAILAVLGSDSVGTFAVIGGVALGILWVLRGLFVKNPS